MIEVFLDEERWPGTRLPAADRAALTGRLPVGAGSFVEVAVKQREGSERLVFDGIPPQIRGVLERALSLAREGRPATAAAFANELKLLL